jgi:prephenate dehydratase
VGALGGPGTFAAQAAGHFVAAGRLVYFPSAREEWQALAAADVDALVMLEESSTTGFGDLAGGAASPDFPYYVAAEAQVPYGCLLLAKSGATAPGIRTILGHGSVSQCKAFLDANFPGVEIAIEQTSSLAAAEKVARGDGTMALVGTARMAELYGLDVLAHDVDGGAAGNYWLVSREPRFHERPRRLIVSGRLEGPRLGEAIVDLAAAGYRVRTMAPFSTGKALFQYDYLLALAGEGELRVVRPLLRGMRLVGAFSD